MRQKGKVRTVQELEEPQFEDSSELLNNVRANAGQPFVLVSTVPKFNYERTQENPSLWSGKSM